MSDQTTTPSTQDEPELASEQPLYISPTLAALASNQRPSPSPACETCPASMWFKTSDQLKCFCSRMHLVVYDDTVPPISHCDGRELALIALQEATQEQGQE